MKKKLISHIISLTVIGVLFIVIAAYLVPEEEISAPAVDPLVSSLTDLREFNIDDKYNKALLKDVHSIFYPQQSRAADSLILKLEAHRPAESVYITPGSALFSGSQIFTMYLKFVFIYVLVLALTYYSVHTFALLRFVREKQGKNSYASAILSEFRKGRDINTISLRIKKALRIVSLVIKMMTKALLYLILFSPAYILAYSFKTKFDTNSIAFMIILGVISNSVLITYAQKFYTFLITENRKGYVQTARVKNLDDSYNGISLKQIFALKKSFTGHILDPIYANAKYQYLPAVREQASFIITGLIIIEMALNIQDHLCYALLQSILYQSYDTVLLIVFGIFTLVKFTEMAGDYLFYRINLKYENLV